ncbi:MAG: HlyC/CorC family transporter [Chloroflexi bacterium]|nr:HlyC/CorC family transporter [Chloroflexota bacterium]
MINSIQLLYLILIFVCLVFSAFFSSSETAFISLQRLRLKHLMTSGVAGANRVAKVLEKPERLLSTILLGNNLVNTAAATLGTLLAVALWGEARGALIAAFGMTALLLVLGEVSPKVWATQHSERLALLYVRPLEAISSLFRPFVAALSWISKGVTRLTGGTPAVRSLVSEEEIRTMISVGQEEGAVEETEAEMMHKVLEFGDRLVRETMVPRPHVTWIEKGTRLNDFLAVYAQSPHSRFPVFEESTDNVVGILSIKDVLMAQANSSIDRDSPLDSLIRPAYFVPETKRMSELLAEMQATANRMAIVVDEFGGIDGVVTLEQLVESIVGSLHDEMAGKLQEFKAIDERTFELDGSMRVEEANQELELGLPDGDYETIAGFMLSQMGHIPIRGEQLKYNRLRLIVTEMHGMRIAKIRITKE